MSSPSSVFKAFPPGEAVGPYTIVRLLPSGEGGQARVYEAMLTGTPRSVALKVALPGKDASLRDEVALMKHHHPNIIQLVPTPIGGGREEYILRDPRTNVWYFAMEYLPGGSLGDWLDRCKKLPIGTAVAIARQMALALEVAHSAGLVHRDIKPSNILFRQPPEKATKIEAVLTDFGISSPQVHITGDAETLTALTVEYASPEQARLAEEVVANETAERDSSAEIPVGPQSDLYSLATILYEMLTGHLPFRLHPHDDLAYLHKVAYDPPELPIPDVPTELNAVLERALHKDPAERYPSASAFAEDLKQLSIKPVLSSDPAQRWIVGAVGLAAGLVVGLIVGFAIGRATVVSLDTPTPVASSVPASFTPTIMPTITPTDTLTPTATDTPVPPTSTLKPAGTLTTATKIAPPATAAQ